MITMTTGLHLIERGAHRRPVMGFILTEADLPGLRYYHRLGSPDVALWQIEHHPEPLMLPAVDGWPERRFLFRERCVQSGLTTTGTAPESILEAFAKGNWIPHSCAWPRASHQSAGGLPPHRRVVRGHLRARNGALAYDSMCGACRNGAPYLD